MLDVDIANIPEGGAAVLNNWYPSEDGPVVRGGSQQRNTGLGGEVVSILKWEGPTRKAFAVTATAMFDVTAAGAVGAASISGLATGIWSSVNFTTSGGTFLIAVASGGNQVNRFNGTTWLSEASAPAITSVPASKLCQVWNYVNRLFFVERNSTNAWYLGPDSIGGALVVFPLGGEFQSGGKLLAGGQWSSDAGDNPQSQCVFVSTEGDVVVYEGPDPASWSKRGSYKIARPLGPNCMFRTGGDLAIMTEAGLFAMSQVVSLDPGVLSQQSVSKNIRPLWKEQAALSTHDRWQIIRRDGVGHAIVLPVKEAVGAETQLVANMETGAWATWSGWLPTCIADFGGELIFGTVDGRIVRGDVTGQDEGTPYTCSAIGRFQMAGGGTINVRLSRAVMRAVETFAPRVAVAVDYSKTLPVAPSSGLSQGGSRWDIALWDVDFWGGEYGIRQPWQAVTGRGWAVAPIVMITFGQIDRPAAQWLRSDILYELGEIVG
jgi:hypothetical protein